MELNFLDRFINFVNPNVGARRIQSRLKTDFLIEHARKIDAGSNGRRTKGWKTSTTGPNAEMSGVNKIRERARDLIYNDSDASSAVRIIVSNTVGTGIRPSLNLPSDVRKSNKGKKTKEILNKEWKQFAEKRICDFNGKYNIYGLTKQIFYTVVSSGSCIVRVRRNSKGFPFSFQVFEPEILDRTKDNYQLQNGGLIHQGIEFDMEGRKVAYWLYDRNPYDNMSMYNPTSKRIPLEDGSGIPNILHVFDQVRPGQADGLPFGITSFLTIRDLGIFEDAQLIKQQMSAMFAGFIYDNTTESSTAGLTKDENGNPIDRLEPGMIEVLPTGKDIKFSSPPSTDGQPEYIKTQKRRVSSGYGVTYEDLTGDLSNANFSSLKAGRNSFKLLVSDWQENIIINDFLTPVWNIFLYGCDLLGKIKITDYQDPSNDFPVSWTPPAFAMVDPTKEVPALIKMVRAGLASWQDVQRQFGNDPEETLAEIKADFDAFKEGDILVDSDPRADPNRVKVATKPPE